MTFLFLLKKPNLMNQKQERKIQMNRFLTTGRDKKINFAEFVLEGFQIVQFVLGFF